MSLKDIYCQERAIDVLQKAHAAGKVAHAYIFAGPDGVGKYKTAREFGKMLLCQDPVKTGGLADSCGRCESCRLVDSDAHPDFHHVYKELLEFTRDGKGKASPVEFPIDVVREFVIDKAAARPVLSARRVFILAEAEKLNTSSQNCLLKVLEEPPAYCCIILVCTRMDALLSTIRSRCQAVRFGPVSEKKILEKVIALGLGKEKGTYFARLSEGSVGLACRWAELEQAGAGLYEAKRRLVDAIAGGSYADCIDAAAQIASQVKTVSAAWSKLCGTTSGSDIKRRAQKTMVQIAISALHDAMLAGIGADKPMINFDQPEQVNVLAGRLNSEQLAEKIAECFELPEWIESAVNEKLIYERLLLGTARNEEETQGRAGAAIASHSTRAHA